MLAGTIGRSGPGETPTPGSVPTAGSVARDPAWEVVAQQVVSARFRAVADHDRAAFLATLADPGSDFGRQQLQVYDQMERLPLSHLGAQVTSVEGLTSRSFVARVSAHYALTGYDQGIHDYSTDVTFVRSGGTWRTAAPESTSSTAETQPWDLPGMRVTSSRTTLVIGNVPPARLEEYRDDVDRGMTAVDQTWRRHWPHRVVVVAPATVEQAGAQLAVSAHELDDVAAETLRDFTQDQPDTTDRVVVNPAAFADLSGAGRAAVLAHETTHVAVGSSLLGILPTWLSEGMADYVGYGSIEVPDDRVDGDLVEWVRRHGVPTSLPPDRAFHGGDAEAVGAAYNEGWLAVRLIVEQVGPGGLTRLLGRIGRVEDDGTDPQAATRRAFVAVLGRTEAEFTGQWRDEVRRVTARP